MSEDQVTDKFAGSHSLIVPSEDGSRVEGIRLESSTFRQVAHLVLGDWDAVNTIKNIEVSSIKPIDFSEKLQLWHVRVGNAIVNIPPENVVYHFDMPLPKEDVE